MDLNNNDELELEIEIEDVPQVDVEDVPDVESGESNETTETIEVDELVVNDKIESGEISEEPDLILEDESEEVYLEETVEDAVHWELQRNKRLNEFCLSTIRQHRARCCSDFNIGFALGTEAEQRFYHLLTSRLRWLGKVGEEHGQV